MEENKDFMNESMKIVNSLVDEVFKIDSNDEQEKQVLGAYLFGMINGLGQEMNIYPAEVQSAMIQILGGKMAYSLEIAVQFSQFLINSTDRTFHPTMFAIIHRGLEGYYMYKDGKNNELTQDFQGIIEAVKEES